MPIIFAMMSQCAKCWYSNIMLNFIILNDSKIKV